ncbi:S1 family peptidase [Devriesea agamarum]|uniref:S1 family peptidase n=1 Tax=Devriesea agamarum TaxID=472569 RepID=UPI00071C9563|nr:S1 family peptidase [Devriesea agamarum]
MVASMRRLGIALASLLLAAVGFPAAAQAVYHGEPVTLASESSWVATVKSDRGAVCTGSLVNSRWVLTAAHCLGGKISVKFGAKSDEQPRQVVREVQFGRGDAAMLELSAPVTDRSPIPLATEAPKEGQKGTVLGVGGTPTLSKGEVGVIGFYTSHNTAMFVTQSYNGAGPQQGDSGGPTISGGKLIGVTSSIGARAEDGTIQANHVQVSALVPWINGLIK